MGLGSGELIIVLMIIVVFVGIIGVVVWGAGFIFQKGRNMANADRDDDLG